MNSGLILVLDFGGKEAYYTARRLRGERFYCEILPGDTDPSELISLAPNGIILAGGDTRTLRAQALPFDPELPGVPMLAFGGASRMLAERIGAEEGCLLKQLRKKDPEAHDALIAKVFTGFNNYNDDPELLEAVHEELLQALCR